MGIIKRAFVYIYRKWKKSLVLFAIFFVLLTLVLSGISIWRTADAAAKELRASFTGYFRMEENHDEQGSSRVTDAIVDRVMEVEGITAVNKMQIFNLVPQNIMLESGGIDTSGEIQTRFLSNTDSSLHEYFATRAFRLAEGRHISPADTNKMLISKPLAQANQLAVGDTVIAEIPEKPELPGNPENISLLRFEIIGIYEINIEQPIDARTPAANIASNFMFIDEDMGKEILQYIVDETADFYGGGASFYVDDPQKMDDILDRVQRISEINSSFAFSVNNAAYNRSAQPLTQLTSYLMVMIASISAISIVLLSLILVMWMRDRTHEIGIYLSVGIRKRSIFAQHMAEVSFVLLLAVFIAWPISGFVVNNYSGALLGSIPQERQETEMTDYTPRAEIETAQGLDEKSFAPVIDLRDLLLLIGYAILVLFVSVGVSSIPVLRMKPKEIIVSMS